MPYWKQSQKIEIQKILAADKQIKPAISKSKVVPKPVQSKEKGVPEPVQSVPEPVQPTKRSVPKVVQSVPDVVQLGKQSLSEVMDLYEKRIIRLALKQCEGSKTATAKLLQIGRQTLIRKLKKYNL